MYEEYVEKRLEDTILANCSMSDLFKVALTFCVLSKLETLFLFFTDISIPVITDE